LRSPIVSSSLHATRNDDHREREGGGGGGGVIIHVLCEIVSNVIAVPSFQCFVNTERHRPRENNTRRTYLHFTRTFLPRRSFRTTSIMMPSAQWSAEKRAKLSRGYTAHAIDAQKGWTRGWASEAHRALIRGVESENTQEIYLEAHQIPVLSKSHPRVACSG